MITVNNIYGSNYFTDAEKKCLEHMLIWEERHSEDAFISPDESGLIELGIKNVFVACRHLIELGILKVRGCEAIAYEWNDKNLIKNYIWLNIDNDKATE